jgi:Kef-type K+ transport system membrane component KefB
VPAEPTGLLPAPEVIGYVLADLVVILVAARLLGTLFVRLRQPRVAGEMVAGVLVGPTLLGGFSEVLYPPEALAFLDLFGLVTLALFTFLVGLAVPQHLLRGQVCRVTAVGVAVVAASIGLGFVLGAVLDEPGVWRVVALPDGMPVPGSAHALLVGAALAASALPVIARILQDRGIQETALGALGIGAAAVVTLLTFLVVAAGSAVLDGRGVPASTAVRLGGTAVLAGLLFGLVRPVLARLLARRFRPADGIDPSLFTVLLAGALLTALAASVLGIRGFTGGLLFGAAVPQVPGLAEAVAARLQQFVVVLGIPVFLASSGLQTDLRLVRPEHLGVLALFLAAIAVGKWGVGAAVGRAAGMTGPEAGAVGVLVSCGGLVTLVVALAGRELGIVTPSMQVVLALVAIVSTLATGPLLERYLRPRPASRPRRGPG